MPYPANFEMTQITNTAIARASGPRHPHRIINRISFSGFIKSHRRASPERYHRQHLTLSRVIRRPRRGSTAPQTPPRLCAGKPRPHAPATRPTGTGIARRALQRYAAIGFRRPGPRVMCFSCARELARPGKTAGLSLPPTRLREAPTARRAPKGHHNSGHPRNESASHRRPLRPAILGNPPCKYPEASKHHPCHDCTIPIRDETGAQGANQYSGVPEIKNPATFQRQGQVKWEENHGLRGGRKQSLYDSPRGPR